MSGSAFSSSRPVHSGVSLLGGLVALAVLLFATTPLQGADEAGSDRLAFLTSQVGLPSADIEVPSPPSSVPSQDEVPGELESMDDPPAGPGEREEEEPSGEARRLWTKLVGWAGEADSGSTWMVVAAAAFAFSFLPTLLVLITCYARVLIVLTLLRTALGLQQVPPQQVLAALALLVTLATMSPVLQTAYVEGVLPCVEGGLSAPQGAVRAFAPFREFMLERARPQDLQLFVDLGEEGTENLSRVSLFTLLPAFLLGELRAAFHIGLVLFMPFMIVDLFVAATLASTGLLNLPTPVLSVPFKLLLFVMVDGWHLLVSSLATSVTH